jgi:hypothetical protein
MNHYRMQTESLKVRKLTVRMMVCLVKPIVVGDELMVTDSDELLQKGTPKLAQLGLPLDA